MSETPNARMVGLAAMLKWSKSGRGYFYVLALVLLLFPALGALCQAQDTYTVRNSSDVPLFEINFLDIGAPVGGVASGENATRQFTANEKAAIIRAFNYWGQRLFPGTKVPAAVGRVNIGYSATTIANAYAADSNLYESLINGAATPAEVCIGDMNMLGGWTTMADGQITSIPGVPLDAVVIHEVGHALGISADFETVPSDPNDPASPPIDKVAPGPWVDHIIPDPTLEDLGSTGPFHFNGDWASEVYGDVWVPNSGNTNRAIHLDGGYGFLADPNLLSHFDIRNALMTHQAYRNYTGFVEAELAALNDINYDINLRQFFGRSVYVPHQTITYSDGFFEHNGSKNAAGRYDAAGYLNGTYNTADYGVGLHVFADNTDITVTGNDILSIGNYGVGIRSDGAYNTIRIADDVSVHANGTNGTGLLVSFGLGSNVILQGDLQAAGAGGVGARFDFGYNILGYDTTGALGYGYTSGTLGGAIVDNFDISGTLVGDYAAIYIDDTARVDAINVLAGASITGDIRSDSADITRLTFGQSAVNGVANGASDNTFNYRYAGTIDGNFDIETWGGTITLDDIAQAHSGFVGLGTEESTLVLPGNTSFEDMTVTMQGILDGAGTGSMNVDNILANAGQVFDFVEIRTGGVLRNSLVKDAYGNDVGFGSISNVGTLLAKSIENGGLIESVGRIEVLVQNGAEGTPGIPGTPVSSMVPGIAARPTLYGTLTNEGIIRGTTGTNRKAGTIIAGNIINKGLIEKVQDITIISETATEGFPAIPGYYPTTSATQLIPAIPSTPDVYGSLNNDGILSEIGRLRVGSIVNNGAIASFDNIEVISASAVEGSPAVAATATSPLIPAVAAKPIVYGSFDNNGIVSGAVDDGSTPIVEKNGNIVAGNLRNTGLIESVQNIEIIKKGATNGFPAVTGTSAIPSTPIIYGDITNTELQVDAVGNIGGGIMRNIETITAGNINNAGWISDITGTIDVKNNFINNGIVTNVAVMNVQNSLVNNMYLANVEQLRANSFQNIGLFSGSGVVAVESPTGQFDENNNPIMIKGTFENDGIIAPGGYDHEAFITKGDIVCTEVGTLTVDGNFSSTLGTFIVGINGETSSRIDVVNGDAVINGGSVEISLVDEMSYLLNHDYVFLNVDPGLDTFMPYGLNVRTELTAVQVDDPLLKAVARYDDQTYWVSLNRAFTYSGEGKTANQRSVAKYLDVATVYPAGDLRTVLLALQDTRLGAAENTQRDRSYVVAEDPLCAALARIGGSIYGTETSSSFRNTVMLHTTLANVMRRDYNHVGATVDAYNYGGMMRVPTDNLWGMIYGHAGSSQHDGNVNGYHQGFSGIMAGFDRKNNRRLRLGFFLSMGDGSLSSDLNDRSLSKELMMGHYFRRDTDSTYFLAQAGFGVHQFETRRHLMFGSEENFVNRTATNEHNAFLLTGHFETGLKYRGGMFNLSPYVGLEFTGLLREGFTEKGAGSLNLTADREDYMVIRPMFGLRFDSSPLRLRRGMASFYGNVAWMYEFEANERPSTFVTRFSEGGVLSGQSFLVNGNDPGRDWVQAGFGLNFDFNPNLRGFAGYDAYANSGQVLHSANLGFMLQR